MPLSQILTSERKSPDKPILFDQGMSLPSAGAPAPAATCTSPCVEEGRAPRCGTRRILIYRSLEGEGQEGTVGRGRVC